MVAHSDRVLVVEEAMVVVVVGQWWYGCGVAMVPVG